MTKCLDCKYCSLEPVFNEDFMNWAKQRYDQLPEPKPPFNDYVNMLKNAIINQYNWARRFYPNVIYCKKLKVVKVWNSSRRSQQFDCKDFEPK